MKILAFDTCFGACSAALIDAQEGRVVTLAASHTAMTRGHAESLIPMIDAVLARGETGLAAIDRFAVTVGPGTFTGVRVGIAAARALALATATPLVGIGTLEAIAATALTTHGDIADGTVAVIVNARRDQVYLQTFERAGDTISPAMADPVICDPGDVPAQMPSKVVAVIGSGGPLVAWPGRSPPPLAATDIEPDAIAVARLAALCAPVGTPVSPLYLRPPDAKPQSGFALEREA